MDVDLILENDRLVRGQGFEQPSDQSQTTLTGAGRPRATHNRFGHAPPDTQSAQQPAHGGARHRNAGPLRQHSNEQFLRPGGPTMAVVARAAFDGGNEGQDVLFVDFGPSAVAAGVDESGLAIGAEAIRTRSTVALAQQSILAMSRRLWPSAVWGAMR